MNIPIFDADSHLSEAPDLWTSRMSLAKWGDAIPQVAFDERIGRERWYVAGKKLTTVSSWAPAGWHSPPPGHPPTIAEADPAAFYVEPRLEKMDNYGIYSQVIYPNLLAFSHHAFMAADPQFSLDCVRAYNDYLADWSSTAPDRFVLLAYLPFWDVEASIAEIDRCADSGRFRGAIFIAKPQNLGLPRLADEHWSPVFSRLEELGWSVNFHNGFAEFSEDEFRAVLSKDVDRRDYAWRSATTYVAQAETIAYLCMSGLCARHPGLRFVSVESAFGWVPSFVEGMDWQWLNSGADRAYPELELPSTYFRRQVYGMFWFETEALKRQIDMYPDNVMFETDFPHPTSLAPGPASPSEAPDLVARKFVDGLSEDLAKKLLWENGAGLYGLDDPPPEWKTAWLS